MRLARERKYRLRGGKARTTRFIPDADRELAQMARHFTGQVAAHADRFGVSQERVIELEAAVVAFREALVRTMQRSSAGPGATARKNDARREVERILRAVAQHLRGLPEGVLTSVDRMNLNLPERPKRVKRLRCPQVAPVLRFVGSTDPHGRSAHGARHILEYRNDFDYSSSAKPHGAARLELFVELVPVGEAIPSHPAERSGGRLWYLRSFTTSRFEVVYPMVADGTPMVVCYWGRWADASGGVGPFSRTCVARVEGGAAAQALPGARVEEIRVMQVRDELEAKFIVFGEGMLPGGFADQMRSLPAGQGRMLEAG